MYTGWYTRVYTRRVHRRDTGIYHPGTIGGIPAYTTLRTMRGWYTPWGPWEAGIHPGVHGRHSTPGVHGRLVYTLGAWEASIHPGSIGG